MLCSGISFLTEDFGKFSKTTLHGGILWRLILQSGPLGFFFSLLFLLEVEKDFQI